MFETVAGRPHVRIGKFRAPLPASRPARVALGVALCVASVFSFLPVLGIWMLPAGLIVLSVDSAVVRRRRRRFDLRAARWARARTGPLWLISLLRDAGLRP